jgi:hypothetical protein
MDRAHDILRTAKTSPISDPQPPSRPETENPASHRHDWPVFLAALLVPMCCLLPLLLVSLTAWLATQDFEVAAPLAWGFGGAVIAVAALWLGLRSVRRAARRRTGGDDACCG